MQLRLPQSIWRTRLGSATLHSVKLLASPGALAKAAARLARRPWSDRGSDTSQSDRLKGLPLSTGRRSWAFSEGKCLWQRRQASRRHEGIGSWNDVGATISRVSPRSRADPPQSQRCVVPASTVIPLRTRRLAGADTNRATSAATSALTTRNSRNHGNRVAYVSCAFATLSRIRPSTTI